MLRQVSWLAVITLLRAFPAASMATSGFVRSSSPLTVAGAAADLQIIDLRTAFPTYSACAVEPEQRQASPSLRFLSSK